MRHWTIFKQFHWNFPAHYISHYYISHTENLNNKQTSWGCSLCCLQNNILYIIYFWREKKLEKKLERILFSQFHLIRSVSEISCINVTCQISLHAWGREASNPNVISFMSCLTMITLERDILQHHTLWKLFSSCRMEMNAFIKPYIHC